MTKRNKSLVHYWDEKPLASYSPIELIEIILEIATQLKASRAELAKRRRTEIRNLGKPFIGENKSERPIDSDTKS